VVSSTGGLERAVRSIRGWAAGNGPCVLLVAVPHEDDGASRKVASLLGLESDEEIPHILRECLVATVAVPTAENSQPTKTMAYSSAALRNMADDAVTTRYVLSGIDPDDGHVLSHDAIGFLWRIVRGVPGRERRRGTAWSLPVLAVPDPPEKTGPPALLGLRDLLEAAAEEAVARCSPCDGPAREEEEEEHRRAAAYLHRRSGTWWDQTRAEILNDSLSSNLFEKVSKWDSHVYLVDVLGPSPYAPTVPMEALREVEELEGCPMGRSLRPMLMARLGYDIQTVPGAFVYAERRHCGDKRRHRCGSAECVAEKDIVFDRMGWVDIARDAWGVVPEEDELDDGHFVEK